MFNGLPRLSQYLRQKLRYGAIALVTLLLVIISGLFSSFSAQTVPSPLTMATSADYRPFEFHDTSTGRDEIVGFDIDVARNISQQLGFELNIVDMDFSGLIPALQSGRADFVMAGMTPTPERQQNADFSILYFNVKNTILSKKGSPFTTLESLQGKSVGALLGSTQQDLANTIPQVTVKVYNKVTDAIQDVIAGRIQAALVEEFFAKGYVVADPNLMYTIIPGKDSGYAIAFPQGSTLVEPFNRAITNMKQDGTIARLEKKWLDAQTKPEAWTTQRIMASVMYMLGGIPVTLAFTAVSAIFGFIWAIILVLAKISVLKPLRWLANAYTSIFRGTPLILQIALVYFATPQLTGYDIPAFQAGVIAFALNSGAYISETLRSGILSVDKGQREAAMSLGVPYRQMMSDIIMPQAIKNILPALANELINLLKDSALVSTIGAADLLRRANVVGAETYLYFQPLIFVGVIYYLMVMVLTIATSVLEKRMQRSA
ncbi:ABC transporter substrate-binding protein/permease [Candidatus Synechococcus calcipolaris G9]|uniref:ABC transporter substrate-binding protein/permease n=1 Tax=Candidatus Synechococcus calcipolaris G9 TaxID=1497997 RepID=A0ABT6EX21_9SYNE|nr:ABC transporter substrate-binding protein/permease [Candidatus Synechococcus calcipolaris]MDG2990345.1 ABC transporter substrate-binding protein/permease [Candidatus Synechococcus calcipolaris G9]